MAGDHRRRRLAQEEPLNVSAGVLFGLVAAVSWGVSDFFIALFSRRIGWFRTMVGISIAATGAFTLVFLALLPEMEIPLRDWMALIGLSAIVVPNYIAFYRALEFGPIALVSPIVTAYAAVVVLLSVTFLGERLEFDQMIGVALAVAGVVLASADIRQLAPGVRRMGPGVLLAIAALFGFGITIFLAGVFAQRYGWFLPAYLVRVMVSIPLVGVAAIRRQWPWQGIGAPMIGLLALIGILESGGFFAFTRGAELGLISIVAAATTFYPLLPLALGMAFFRERPAPNQYFGIAMVLGGVMILGISG